jgi:CPA2 family monovalent cation:H+ antiporter-2
MQVNTAEEHRLLHDLIHASKNIEVVWLPLIAGHPLIGQTLAAANLRARTGASVVAILRDRELMANPKSMTVFRVDDRIGLIGDQEEIEAAKNMLTETESESNPVGVEWET